MWGYVLKNSQRLTLLMRMWLIVKEFASLYFVCNSDLSETKEKRLIHNTVLETPYNQDRKKICGSSFLSLLYAGLVWQPHSFTKQRTTQGLNKNGLLRFNKHKIECVEAPWNLKKVAMEMSLRKHKKMP